MKHPDFKGNSTSGFLASVTALYFSPLWKNVEWFLTKCPSAKDYHPIFESLEEMVLLTSPHRVKGDGFTASILENAVPLQEVLGRLSTKDEPGKVRIFALVDVLTQ